VVKFESNFAPAIAGAKFDSELSGDENKKKYKIEKK